MFKIPSGIHLVLDGAMGTEIEKRGCDTSSFLWSAQVLLDNPLIVQEIHNEYLKAGADIIITNTFRTCPYSFKKAGYNESLSIKSMLKAIELAVNAKNDYNKEAYIFGSIAPLEDCFRPDMVPEEAILRTFHKKTLESMDKVSAIDVIIFETQNNIKEIKIISTLIEQFDHPIGLSLTLNNKGDLLDGTSWKEVVKLLENSSFSLFGVNCSSPTIITKGLQKLNAISQLDKPLMAYANVGLEDPLTHQLNDNITGDDYLDEGINWLDLGVSIIGSCCGTDPKVTQKLAKYFKNL